MRQKKQLFEAILLMGLGLLFLLPLTVTFSNSWMTEAEIFCNYTEKPDTFDLLEGVSEGFLKFRLIPEQVTFGQYYEVLLRQPPFLLLLENSLKLSVPVTLGSLLVSVLTAYGFTVWDHKYKEILFQIYVIVMLMPLQAVLVPNYVIAERLHIKDSYLAIILPGIFSPFGVFLMRQSMKAIPTTYFEAARIDGANDGCLLFYIIIPQLKSSAAALCMLVFLEYWNLVEQAVIFISDYSREPLSVYLSRISEGKRGLIFAASCIYMLPPLWLLLAGQKNLEKGIELSGVKQ